MKRLLMPARRTGITDRNGSTAAFSSAPAAGIADGLVFMAMLIMGSMCEGDIAGRCRRAVRLPGLTLLPFGARRCTIRVAAKRREGEDNSFSLQQRSQGAEFAGGNV
jgi:hypothetical protein